MRYSTALCVMPTQFFSSSDSINLLEKEESGMNCPDSHTAMHSLRLQRLLWIYCHGHPGVRGNERADWQAQQISHLVCRHSILQSRERPVFYQTNIGPVSKATLGRLLRDGVVECVWAFSSATMPSRAETETETER